MANNAINADGLGQRAFGASTNPASYGERYQVARIPLMRRARLASASPPFPTLAAPTFGHLPFLLMG
jgi:hypothetical protein